VGTPVRVRYAPAPTGSQHVGGARTALYNMMFARHAGGTFVLRIEDTDRERNREGARDAIVDALRWLGLSWDEGPDVGGPFGPYEQSGRLESYRVAATQLAASGLAYPCFCTPERLAELRGAARAERRRPGYDGRCRSLTPQEREAAARATDRPALRLDVARVAGQRTQVVVSDLIRGEVAFDLSVLDDFVILKSDGMPTYNFAAVLDDQGMAISHVIRADEHLSNTPRQILVCWALGIEPPRFAHISMVLAPDRSKLSKRHGATGVEEFRAQGYLPEAMVNYLMLLGWSHPSEQEFFTLDEAARVFELERVSRTAAVYDVAKLTWMNAHYLRTLAVDDVARRVRPFLADLGIDPGKGVEADARLARRVALVRERAQTLRQLADGLSWFYADVDTYDEAGVRKHFGADAVPRLRAALDALADAERGGFGEGDIAAAFTARAEQAGVPRAQLIHPVRLAVTGRTVGPGLFELLAELGPGVSRERVLRAIERCEAGAAATS
jgi:nondiscriminating glutamyl-tRNA synthetase